MPPLFIDPAVRAKVTAGTLASYRKAALTFVAWLEENHLIPSCAVEWDDLLVEWKFHTSPTKSAFTTTLAAVEFFFAQYKGELKWSHHVKSSWDVVHVPRHTVPMLSGITRLYSVHCSAMRLPRLGVGMVLQQMKGLRPSELLGVLAHDVVLPEEMDTTGVNAVIVGLGVRKGTKSKRPQSAVLNCDADPHLVAAIRLLKELSAAEDRLFPYSLEQYNRVIKKISKNLQLDIHYTPHSLRAGFASEGRALGKDFTELREEGRWVSDSSLRIYVDVVGAAAIAQSHSVKALRPAIAASIAQWPAYFSRAWLRECDAPGAAPSRPGARRATRGGPTGAASGRHP